MTLKTRVMMLNLFCIPALNYILKYKKKHFFFYFILVGNDTFAKLGAGVPVIMKTDGTK